MAKPTAGRLVHFAFSFGRLPHLCVRASGRSSFCCGRHSCSIRLTLSLRFLAFALFFRTAIPRRNGVSGRICSSAAGLLKQGVLPRYYRTQANSSCFGGSNCGGCCYRRLHLSCCWVPRQTRARIRRLYYCCSCCGRCLFPRRSRCRIYGRVGGWHCWCLCPQRRQAPLC